MTPQKANDNSQWRKSGESSPPTSAPPSSPPSLLQKSTPTRRLSYDFSSQQDFTTTDINNGTTTSTPQKRLSRSESTISSSGRRRNSSGAGGSGNTNQDGSGTVTTTVTTKRILFLRHLTTAGAFMLCCHIAFVSYHHRNYVDMLFVSTEESQAEDSFFSSPPLLDDVVVVTPPRTRQKETSSNSGGSRTKGALSRGLTTTTTVNTTTTTLPPFSPLHYQQQHPIGLPSLTTTTAADATATAVVDVIFEPKVSEEEYFQWVPPHHGSEAAFLQIQPNLGVAVGGFAHDYSSVTSSIQFLHLNNNDNDKDTSPSSTTTTITTTSDATTTTTNNNNKWSTIPLPKDIAETHNAVAYDEKHQWLYIVSGQKGGACLPAVKTAARVYIHKDDPQKQQQEQQVVVEYLPDLPKARFGASAAIVTSPDNKEVSYLHVFGGVTAETRRDISLDHWRLQVYPQLGQEWEILEGPPDAGLHGAAKVYNNTIYYTAFCANDFALFPKPIMKECRKHDFQVSDTHHTSRQGLMFKYNASSSSEPTWERLQDMPMALSHTGNIIYQEKELWFFFGGVQTQLAFGGGPIIPEGAAQVFDFRSQQWQVLPSNLTETISNPYIWIDHQNNSVNLMRPHEWHKAGSSRPYSKMIKGKFQLLLDNNKNNNNNNRKLEGQQQQQLDYLRARKNAVRRETSERFLSCLGVDSMDVCHPFWSTSYEGLRPSWNLAYDQLQQPNVVCLPTSESQVSTIVKCARRGGQALCARSGKHSFSGDTCTYGVVVDVTKFVDIERLDNNHDDDNNNKNMWRFGAGNTLGRVAFELHQKGYVLPAGHCPSVGMTGLILAGGQGPLSRLYGVTSDFVAGVRYVDWQGNVVEATTSNEHKDAVWLARGGGGGQLAFPGIITEWKIQDLPRSIEKDSSRPVYTLLEISFEPTPLNAERLMENYQDFLLDEQLASDPYFNHLTVEVWLANWVKNMPEEPTEANLKRIKGRRVLKVTAYFYGDDKMNEHAEKHFYPRLRGFAEGITKTQMKRYPYLDFQKKIGGVRSNEELADGKHGWNVGGDKWKGYSAVASDKIPGAVFRDLAVAMWDTEPKTFRYTEIKPLRGAIGTKMNKADSAFWHRDALFWSLSSHFWKAPESTPYVQSILEESSQIHRRYEEGMGQRYAGSYAGYKDPGSVVRGELDRYNGGNAAKMANVRQLLDPSNVFRHYLPNNKFASSPPATNSRRSLQNIEESPGAQERRKGPQEPRKEGKEQKRQDKTTIAEGKHPGGRGSAGPMEETFTILRSIGNALPPRHTPEQTVKNLNFTLTREAPFPNVVKHWLVNRLVNETVEKQVIGLLEAHKQNYSVVPFNLSEYSRLENIWDVDHKGTDRVHRISVLQNEDGRYSHHQSKDTQLFLEGLEKPKNLYVTHVNGGRNKMLDIGLRYGTDWIMPLDGNCFFTPETIEAIRQGVFESENKSAYMMIPMVRVLGSNKAYFSGLENGKATSDQVQAVAEPQLMFRKDATARFNLNLWYSRRDKMELLWRLKAEAPGLEPKSWRPWEEQYQEIMKPISDVPPSVPAVGYVYRLDSGRKELDMTDDRMGSKEMMNARAVGVSLLLSQLDERVVRELHHYNSSSLVYLHAHPDSDNAAAALVPSNVSCPDLVAATEIVPELVLVHGSSLGRVEMLEAIHSCLGGAFVAAAKNGTVMDEMFERLIKKKTVRLPHLVDAIRILAMEGQLRKGQLDNIMSVLKKYQRWMERSKIGKESFMSCGARGVRYDVHMTALAGFLDRVPKLVWYLDRSKSRLLLVNETGCIPPKCEEEEEEDGDASTMPGELLTAWSVLARLSQTHHRSNLWTAYPNNNETGDSALCRMASYYLSTTSTTATTTADLPTTSNPSNNKAGAVVVDKNAMRDLVANCPKIHHHVINNNAMKESSSPDRIMLEELPAAAADAKEELPSSTTTKPQGRNARRWRKRNKQEQI